MKDATVSARIEYDLKTEAEDILDQLGVPVSVVITSLYKQIIYQRAIPFSISLPASPKAEDELGSEELNAKLLRGYGQALRGEGRPLKDVFDDLKKGL